MRGSSLHPTTMAEHKQDDVEADDGQKPTEGPGVW